MAEILSNKDTDYPASVYYRFAFFVGQTVVFLGLAIFIDYRKIHAFRGTDKNEMTEERLQLKEHDDVLAHKKIAKEV